MNQAKLIARDAVKMPPKKHLVPQVAIATKLSARRTHLGRRLRHRHQPPRLRSNRHPNHRAVPHITVKAYNGSPLHILAFTSTKRPDYLDNETADNANDLALATYRSLRGADAAALRRYLNQLLKGQP